MIGTVVWLLGATTTHLGIGFAAGWKSWEIWQAEDNESRWGFALFPVNYYCRNIGGIATNLINIIATEFDEPEARWVYSAITAAIWPLRLAALLPSWPVVGILLLLRRRRQEQTA